MKVVIIGTGGRLGSALMREYRERFEIVGFDREQLDLANHKQVKNSLTPLEFDLIVNAVAFTNLDLCETHRDQAFAVNAEAPKILAEVCRDKNAKLIHFSTDYVFDGEKRDPYTEDDSPNPISVYAESKREGEKLVLQMDERHLVVRVSWVFGPERPSFVDMMIQRARETEQVVAVKDKFSAPTYTQDIARMLPQFFVSNAVARVADPGRAAITDRGYSGILHFANAGECSWQEYAQFALDCCRSLGVPLKARKVAGLKLADMNDWIARRPVYSVLSTAKFFSLTGTTPRNWRDAVGDYLRNYYAKR
jgi:dTDP-4-dehydrorhamnose reductase